MTKSFICLRKATILLLLIIGIGNAWGAAKTVKYTQSSTSAISKTSGDAPVGSSATFAATYSTKEQMTAGYSQTFTLKDYGAVAITNITLSMKSNNKSGAGILKYSIDGGSTWTYIAGSWDSENSQESGVNFSDAAWNGAYSGDYVDVSKDVSILTKSDKDFVIYIEATVNSIYCQSYQITYTDEKYTVSYNGGTGTRDKASDTQTTVGQVITLPGSTPPSDCAAKGWEFAGWKKGSAQTVTTEEPVLYEEGASFTPDDNVTLYAVYQFSEERTGCTAEAVTTDANFAVGDQVILYNSSATNQYNGIDGSIGGVTGYTTTPALSHILEVREGSADGKFAFYDKTAKKYLTYSADKSLSVSESVTSNSSWTVGFSAGVVTITNVGTDSEKLQYNTANPRFCCYSSSQTAPQLYKVCPPLVTYNSNPDCTYDWFIDIMHDNETIEKQGTYSMPSALSDADKGEDKYCDEKHYHFLGWVEESEINDDGTLKDGYTLYPAGDSGHTANNKTYYAIWAKEE